MIFAEQYLTVLQRLLIEHAAELEMDYEPTRVDLARTIRAIFAAASVTGAADADLEDGEPDAERWLVYLLKNGLYNAQPPLVNEITRARELFAVLAPTFAHADFCPIDEWFHEDYGLTAAEQLTAGVAVSALTNAFDDEAGVGDRGLTAPPEWRGELASKAEQIATVLAGPLEWYAGIRRAGRQPGRDRVGAPAVPPPPVHPLRQRPVASHRAPNDRELAR